MNGKIIKRIQLVTSNKLYRDKDKIIAIYKIPNVFIYDIIVDPNTNTLFIIGSAQTIKFLMMTNCIPQFTNIIMKTIKEKFLNYLKLN